MYLKWLHLVLFFLLVVCCFPSPLLLFCRRLSSNCAAGRTWCGWLTIASALAAWVLCICISNTCRTASQTVSRVLVAMLSSIWFNNCSGFVHHRLLGLKGLVASRRCS
jgi:hypothetical protein